MKYDSINRVDIKNNSQVNKSESKKVSNQEIESVDVSAAKVSDLHSAMDSLHTDIDIKQIDIIDYAKTFLGTDYNYGSNDLSNGVDCSLFTQIVYKNYGVDLPRNSGEQRNYGTEVSSLNNAKPGDLLCFDGHVGIYMGNDQMIHASSVSDEVKIQDNVSEYVKSRPLVSIRRLL